LGVVSEDDLIARWFAPIAGQGSLGLKDDAACFAPPQGQDLVITKDALVAGVHFFPDDPPASIARKALRVNVSDLAAKGAEPSGFLLALALPQDVSSEWLQAFAAGLGEDAQRWSIALLGGDTVKTPGPLMVSITALGFVPHGRMMARTGVRAGDAIFVSGTIGDAALGLQLRLNPQRFEKVSEASRAYLASRYLEPTPRVVLVDHLRAYATGGMDVSDGLIGDVTKMLKASAVSAEIDLDSVPLSPAAREAIAQDASLFEVALTGGDDYELLISVPEADAARFGSEVPDVTRIGTAKAGIEAPLFHHAGQKVTFKRGSFSHF